MSEEREIVVTYEPDTKNHRTRRPGGNYDVEDAAVLRRAAEVIEFWSKQKECPAPTASGGLEITDTDPTAGEGCWYAGWRDDEAFCHCGRRFYSMQDFEDHVAPALAPDPTAGEHSAENDATYEPDPSWGFAPGTLITPLDDGGFLLHPPEPVPPAVPATPDAGDASEGLGEALHRAFHGHWSPDQPLDLYVDSPLWQKQAEAVERIVAAREAAAANRGLTVCNQAHGHEGNSARVYGHFESRRTCIRIKATDEWVYDPAWETTGV